MRAFGWALVTGLALSQLLNGCGYGGQATQDLQSGETRRKTCVNQITQFSSPRRHIRLDRDSAYVDVPTTIHNGYRVIRLYNEQTCDGRIDTDHFSVTDTYVNTGPSVMGLELTWGVNTIHFVVQQCRSVDAQNGYRCLNEIDSDAGLFIIERSQQFRDWAVVE